MGSSLMIETARDPTCPKVSFEYITPRWNWKLDENAMLKALY